MRNLAPVLVALCLLTFGAPASAEIYEVFIEIETEEDLYDLLTDGEIEEDTFDTLLDLYRRGVDINEADRARLYSLPNLTYRQVDAIIAYRKEAGYIRELADLVANDVLTEAELRSIAPFVWVVEGPAAPKHKTKGHVRFQTRASGKNDRYPPPASLQVRLHTLGKLNLGTAAILQRSRPRDVRYDPNRDGLSAKPNNTVFIVPKLYAEWDDKNWAAIAGTYRIGFGQRLTFDRTNEVTPNGFRGDDEIRRENELTVKCRESTGELAGSPCSGERGEVRMTPDYKWTNRLAGVALGLKKLKLGKKDGYLQAYGWGSYMPKSIYQYELSRRELCDDPRDETNENCKAPPLFVRTPSGERAAGLSYQTLPRMYAEMVAGANVAYHFDDRAHIGVTGYGANVRWLVDGIDLDFNDHAGTPFGGPFGAVGVDGAFGFGIQDFFAEVAHTFDSQVGGGGGLGAIVRSVTGFESTELEVSARYYDKKFANPYGRPISGADEFDGNRARDELGARVTTESRLSDKVALRTKLDFWHASADDALQFEAFARTDVDWTKKFATGLWLTYRNKNLSDGGREECFDETDGETDFGEPIPCFGQKIRAATRLRYKPSKRLALTLQYQHEWLDDLSYDDRFRQDIATIVGALIKPVEKIRIRARVRHDFDDIQNNAREEHTLWTYAELGYMVHDKHWIRGRYDLRFWLDNRASTALREPSPEHWVWLEYEARF